MPLMLLPAAILAGTINGTVRGPDSTSAGIANAKVVLTRSPGGGGSRVTLDSMMTNAQGGYSFANLPTAAAPASYRVTASAAGFQKRQFGRLRLGHRRDHYPQHHPTAPSGSG